MSAAATIPAMPRPRIVTRSITGQPLQTLRSRRTHTWERTELKPLAAPYHARMSGPVLAAALNSGRADVHPGTAGSAVGLIRSIRPTGDMLADLVSGARAALDQSFDAGAHPTTLAQQLQRILS